MPFVSVKRTEPIDQLLRAIDANGRTIGALDLPTDQWN